MLSFFKILFSPIVAILDFITKYFKTIVFLTILYFFVLDTNDNLVQDNSNANLEKIELVGPILDIYKPLDEIIKAKNDEKIKGVLLVVNSPGGAVAPSVELAYAIKELALKKPVVVYASGVIASGSYYASIWANKIVANPGSMVGSIGVIMQGTNVQELLDKVGVKTQVVKAGKYKETGTFTRAWTSYEKEELEGVIKDTYKMFVSDVAKARKLKLSDYPNFAEGRVFTASQAKKVGLIDEVATITSAQRSLIKLSKVKKAVWKKEDRIDKFLDRLISETAMKVSTLFSTGLKAY